MVGPRTTNEDVSSYLRKIRKPMVEKKRRERMNHSISQLKSLIASTIKQHAAPMTRVDKADILELTVFHLTQLQQQQRSVSMATEVAAYNAGFKDCAREAVNYLSTRGLEGDMTVKQLSNHLHTSYTLRSRPQDSRGLHVTSAQPHSHHGNGPQLSTPARPLENVGDTLPVMNLTGYSPIPCDVTHLPELTSSFVTDGLNSTQGSDNSSTGSSWSSLSSSASSESYGVLSGNSSGSEGGYIRSSEVDIDIDVVTIGDGKDNQIGHVIKETIWRPF